MLVRNQERFSALQSDLIIGYFITHKAKKKVARGKPGEERTYEVKFEEYFAIYAFADKNSDFDRADCRKQGKEVNKSRRRVLFVVVRFGQYFRIITKPSVTLCPRLCSIRVL